MPRRHRAERAAGIAHVAQNLYRRGERTLGVMPLYHTMGVRSLIAMSLIGGTFVCLPRYDTEPGAGADRGGTGHQPLSGADALPRPGPRARICLDRRLERAKARLRRRVDDRRAAEEAERGVPARSVRQSLRQLRNLHLHHRPERAGQAGFGRQGRDQSANPGRQAERSVRRPTSPRHEEEGEIIALLAGDESFEGYWRRPDADAKSLRDGWYFTGDTGFVDARRRSVRHRPRRRHDHHRRRERLAGRDRKLPVAAPGRARGRRRRPSPTKNGARSSPPSSSARRAVSEQPNSNNSAGHRGSRISSARGVSSLSMRCRNPRSENCCAACWSRATINAEQAPPSSAA